MNTQDSPTADPDADAGNAAVLRLSSGVDRRCRHCHDVALVYDVVAEMARCRTCGELDRQDGGTQSSKS